MRSVGGRGRGAAGLEEDAQGDRGPRGRSASSAKGDANGNSVEVRETPKTLKRG